MGLLRQGTAGAVRSSPTDHVLCRGQVPQEVGGSLCSCQSAGVQAEAPSAGSHQGLVTQTSTTHFWQLMMFPEQDGNKFFLNDTFDVRGLRRGAPGSTGILGRKQIITPREQPICVLQTLKRGEETTVLLHQRKNCFWASQLKKTEENQWPCSENSEHDFVLFRYVSTLLEKTMDVDTNSSVKKHCLWSDENQEKETIVLLKKSSKPMENQMGLFNFFQTSPRTIRACLQTQKIEHPHVGRLVFNVLCSHTSIQSTHSFYMRTTRSTQTLRISQTRR